MVKEKEVVNKALRKLGYEKFACQKDAEIIAKQFEENSVKYNQ